jgi:hypothetical protein
MNRAGVSERGATRAGEGRSLPALGFSTGVTGATVGAAAVFGAVEAGFVAGTDRAGAGGGRGRA